MKLSEAIAVFDKSAERTTPNKQTEAWAVIRAELVALDAAPLARITDEGDVYGASPSDGDSYVAIGRMVGKRVRLVPASGGE